MYNKLYQVVYIMVLHYNELSVLNILVLYRATKQEESSQYISNKCHIYCCFHRTTVVYSQEISRN